jgi:hypothetical protein
VELPRLPEHALQWGCIPGHLLKVSALGAARKRVRASQGRGFAPAMTAAFCQAREAMSDQDYVAFMRSRFPRKASEGFRPRVLSGCRRCMRGKQIRQNQNVKRGRDRWARPRKFEFSALMIIRCSTRRLLPLSTVSRTCSWWPRQPAAATPSGSFVSTGRT